MNAPTVANPLLYRGMCWRLGNDIAVDGDLMPLRFAIARETRLEVLREHAMVGIDPDFPRKAKPGDIIVAGTRFAQGNPHIQGLLGLRALGVGLVVESIPRGSLRNAINSGVPLLPRCPDVTQEASTGDLLEVDFSTGRFRNLTRSTENLYAPLPDSLLEVIRIGGWEANFVRRLAALRRGASADA